MRQLGVDGSFSTGIVMANSCVYGSKEVEIDPFGKGATLAGINEVQQADMVFIGARVLRLLQEPT